MQGYPGQLFGMVSYRYTFKHALARIAPMRVPIQSTCIRSIRLAVVVRYEAILVIGRWLPVA